MTHAIERSVLLFYTKKVTSNLLLAKLWSNLYELAYNTYIKIFSILLKNSPQIVYF